MTIKECIDIVDNIKPNQYTIKDKVMWLSFIDEIIINEVLKTHEGYDGRYDLFEGYTEDKLSVTLIVPSPYDRLYTAYLKMKIDAENGETARYNNSMVLYNTYMQEYRKHYNKTHMPIDATARRMNVKHPDKPTQGLSDAEYENLKRDLTFILTEYFSDTVSPDKLNDAINKYLMNNVEVFKGKDGYTPKKGVDYWTDADKEEVKQYIKDTVGDIEIPLDEAKAYTDEKVGKPTAIGENWMESDKPIGLQKIILPSATHYFPDDENENSLYISDGKEQWWVYTQPRETLIFDIANKESNIVIKVNEATGEETDIEDTWGILANMEKTVYLGSDLGCTFYYYTDCETAVHNSREYTDASIRKAIIDSWEVPV